MRRVSAAAMEGVASGIVQMALVESARREIVPPKCARCKARAARYHCSCAASGWLV